MSKANHHSLAYKMRAKPNKTWEDLKQKQKMKISDWMFQAVSAYYGEHGMIPEGDDAASIAGEIYHKMRSLAIWVPYEEFFRAFTDKLPRFEMRITEHKAPEDLPWKEEKERKEKKPAAKKKGGSRKTCPNCGRKMKEQFHGLQHCKCGVSWMKNEGYFVRSSDMVFALERRRIGKKVKQCPVIRYRYDESWVETDLEFQEEDDLCLPTELPW